MSKVSIVCIRKTINLTAMMAAGMNNMDVKDFSDEACVEFIKSLEIPAVEPAILTRSLMLTARSGMNIDRPAKNVDSTQDSAFVAGNSVVSFVGGLEPQLKQDVMDSVLFAQLAADKEFPNKDTHRVERYNRYNQILAYCGWTKSSESMDKVTGLKQKFTMDQVALEIIASVVGPNKALLEIVALVFGALAKNPKALSLFENQAKGRDAANFQILPCIATSDGEVIMIRTCMQFSSSKPVTKVLFWEWSSSDVNLYSVAINTQLNRRQYGVVRNVIMEKLGTSGKKFIENIDIDI
ncbi:hypothetical protein [Pseudomonas sp.]|uniref:hypothetical protein n=1 Tax=Pseudomonas sp. TaxID=306 RepID=UPI0023561F36|nr:hypothetical protein [Pseudomonas sp.]